MTKVTHEVQLKTNIGVLMQRQHNDGSEGCRKVSTQHCQMRSCAKTRTVHAREIELHRPRHVGVCSTALAAEPPPPRQRVNLS